MKLGLFGGTFDPPHLGHLAVAEAAAREFSLHRVLLAPTGVQPLKPSGASAPFADRLAMTELLCRDVPQLEASAIDAPLADATPNFTIDTLARVRDAVRGENYSDLEGDVQLFVIVGVDAFLDLPRWREPERLLKEAEWIVVSRPGIALDFSGLALTPEQRSHVHVLGGVDVPVSATEVRARLKERLDTAELLPSGVLAYIREHHLYGT